MQDREIVKRCLELGMSQDEANWVVAHLYDYAQPDWSEWSWDEIDECLRDVLWFRGKTDAEIEEHLKP